MVDHLGLTFPDAYQWGEIAGWVSRGEEWEVRDQGTRGYTNSAVWGLVVLSWGGSSGIHVECSGKACRQLETIEEFDWSAFMQRSIAFGARVSRLDWAFDERSGLLDLGVIMKCIEAGELVSACTTGRETRGFEVGKPGLTGQTVNLGSPSSDSQIRIYDKAAEQGVEGHWVRSELQLRRRRAHASALAFIEHGPKAIAGMLRAAVEFKSISGLSRVKNEAIAPWWSEFLGHADRVVIRTDKLIKTLNRVADWVRSALAPTLGLLSYLPGDPMVWFKETIEQGVDRFGPKHRAILDASRVPRENGPGAVRRHVRSAAFA